MTEESRLTEAAREVQSAAGVLKVALDRNQLKFPLESLVGSVAPELQSSASRHPGVTWEADDGQHKERRVVRNYLTNVGGTAGSIAPLVP